MLRDQRHARPTPPHSIPSPTIVKALSSIANFSSANASVYATRSSIQWLEPVFGGDSPPAQRFLSSKSVTLALAMSYRNGSLPRYPCENPFNKKRTLGTATSASWNMTYLECPTTPAPMLANSPRMRRRRKRHCARLFRPGFS